MDSLLHGRFGGTDSDGREARTLPHLTLQKRVIPPSPPPPDRIPDSPLCNTTRLWRLSPLRAEHFGFSPFVRWTAPPHQGFHHRYVTCCSRPLLIGPRPYAIQPNPHRGVNQKCGSGSGSQFGHQNSEQYYFVRSWKNGTH